MFLSVQNSGYLAKDVNYFGDFSLLFGDLMATKRCSLAIILQALCFGGTRQVYHDAHTQ
jgi:hypothetical protein